MTDRRARARRARDRLEHLRIAERRFEAQPWRALQRAAMLAPARWIAALEPSIDKNSFGLAVQAGVDIPMGGGWLINVDVKKVWINTDVHLDTALGPVEADVDINPLIVGVGVSYRW